MSTDPLHAYYDAWQHGAEHYDAAALGELLATDLDFEGPLAGHRVGAEGFIRGLYDFAKNVRSIQMLCELRAGEEAAFLYDCKMVFGDTLRVAEFIAARDGRIMAVKIHYDKADFRAAMSASEAAPA